MSRIFVTGDTHGGSVGDLNKLNSKKFPIGKTLTKNEYVIVAGDFGCVWSAEGSKGHKHDLYTQNWLHEKPWTTLFIDGNHENHDMLAKLEEVKMFGDVVGKVNDSIYHLKRGRVYNINGKSIFTMGGAESLDKENRTLGISYWKEEVPSYKEMDLALENLGLANWKVDYVITHNCPNRVGMRFITEHNAQGLYNTKISDPTATFLDHLYIDRDLQYKKWFYGHWHKDWQYDDFRLVYQNVVELE